MGLWASSQQNRPTLPWQDAQHSAGVKAPTATRRRRHGTAISAPTGRPRPTRISCPCRDDGLRDCRPFPPAGPCGSPRSGDPGRILPGRSQATAMARLPGALTRPAYPSSYSRASRRPAGRRARWAPGPQGRQGRPFYRSGLVLVAQRTPGASRCRQSGFAMILEESPCVPLTARWPGVRADREGHWAPPDPDRISVDPTALGPAPSGSRPWRDDPSEGSPRRQSSPPFGPPRR